jgi:hypothetical protein
MEEGKTEWMKQPTFQTCGQTGIAMIAGKSVDEVIRDMKTSGPTSLGRLIEILDKYGIRHAEKNVRLSKKILSRILILFWLFMPRAATPIGPCFMRVDIMTLSSA